MLGGPGFLLYFRERYYATCPRLTLSSRTMPAPLPSSIGRSAPFLRALPFVVGAVLSVGALCAQPLQPRELKPGWEQWHEKVPVSGGVRVGVMAVDEATAVDPRSFVAFLPASDLPLLCVEISSKDGRYEANLEFELAGRNAGLLRFELPTKHRNELSRYAPPDLAILARLGRDCTAPPDRFVVAGWTDRALADTIVVFVNSDAPTMIVAGANGVISESAPCEEIVGGAAPKAYNLACRVPKSWVGADTQFWVRQRIRRGRTVKLTDYDLPLGL